MLRIEHGEALQILGGHRHLAEAFGTGAHESHDPTDLAVGLHSLPALRLAKERCYQRVARARRHRHFRHAASPHSARTTSTTAVPATPRSFAPATIFSRPSIPLGSP